MWQPAIGANQVFSLSQHWYSAGVQTAECGWQVYPALYGDARPHLFTYWTADGYNKTGCYNLTCSAFVQTSSTFAPGMAIGPISVSGGSQYVMELAYWLTGGRWWLYYNGKSGSNAIGYYPATLYQNAPLATKATEIDYGGETVGTTTFPPMGSGAFANQGVAAGRLPADHRVLAAGRRRDGQREPDGGPGMPQLLHGGGSHVRGALVRDALVWRPGRYVLAASATAIDRRSCRRLTAAPCWPG